ncbi:protein NDRG2-like [Bufo gargarizans]|uniref:protein NDRG2-like n=1 Tax=Bufo gargarizans TaxID=30331 RepID=UPI001CF2C9D0|nr:protein NDRG2-like [Bufo gargarizans]
MYEIVKNFVVCHIDAPGQEEGAAVYPAGYQYPSLDQLSETIPCVLQYLNFPSIIGIGVGAGAYVLARYTVNDIHCLLESGIAQLKGTCHQFYVISGDLITQIPAVKSFDMLL